jgi:hypothetical protein
MDRAHRSCTVQVPAPGHFVYVDCARPARWVMPHGGHVCSACRLEYLAHMPGDLFARVAK